MLRCLERDRSLKTSLNRASFLETWREREKNAFPEREECVPQLISCDMERGREGREVLRCCCVALKRGHPSVLRSCCLEVSLSLRHTRFRSL